jgi:hypothetical protein
VTFATIAATFATVTIYLVTPGEITIIPSITLVLIPLGAVISKSKTDRPAVRLAVFAAVIDIVISPLALPVTVAVIIVFDVA